MKRAILVMVLALFAASVGAWSPGATAQPSAAGGQSGPSTPNGPGQQGPEGRSQQATDQPVPALDVYTATVTSEQAAQIFDAGVDVANTQQVGNQVQVDAVLSQTDQAELNERLGVDMQLKRNAQGQTARQMAAAQAEDGYQVWRSWDEEGGIADEIDQIAREHRDLVKREVIGETYNGREIVALKVTDNARRVRDGRRPAVLYISAQHAREWISVEVNRRLLHWYLDQHAAGNREVRNLLRHNELWFVLVSNPDGYQFTFDGERMWRKNLRDNDENGEITLGDGVDPNRNFDEHWGYDEEGSSSVFSSDTYRGPSPASEPETQAMQGLIDRIEPRTMSNWHSYADQILFAQGWQVGTPDADNPIYTALAGTDAQPAIPGFDPGVSADELYVTNGETTDYADVNAGTVAFTPELGEGAPGAGFIYPDDEGLIQAEFEDTLDFALGLARSAHDPADPASPVGIETEPFYLDLADIDPENDPLSMFDFRFDVSYGSPQDVRVLARRDLGRVTARYRVNGGRVRSTSTREWTGGERYGVGGPDYYRVMRGRIRDTEPGDSVEVWFESGEGRHRQRSDSFTYEVVSDTGNPVLVLAAEDYTGASPVYADQSGPNFLSFYTDALEANDVDYDVYDVDANGRTAADALGVLSHYDAVVWYTGNDAITREAGWGAGTASSLAMTEILEVRDYLNEGGRVLYAGKYAGHQYATGHGAQLYDPFENAQCTEDIADRCRTLYGSGDNMGDVLEYWFGAGTVNEDAGTNPDTGNLYDVTGTDTPLDGLSWGFNGDDSAQNQDHSASFLTTSGLLPVEEFPQFESWAAAGYDRPGGPFSPHSGDYYLYSQMADASYKRLTRTVDVPAGGATLSFWVSQTTEPDWDYLFVEAHTPGQDDWTTLPDANGHTTQGTGSSCVESSGWRTLHPQLDHYQTRDDSTDPPTCTPVGTTGEWNASTGTSGGWQQWSVDLSAYAGGQVELSLSYASDWGTQGLGVFLDDIAVSTGEGSTDFESDLGGWTVAGPPEGSGPNANDWERITAAGFPEAAVVATDDTLYMGFGLEGITGADARATVMGRAIDYLLRDD